MPAATLSRLVFLEALRGGLPWLAVAAIALGAGLAAFLSQVALTESVALRTAIVAALLRACAMFLIAAQVASSTLREIDDKSLELVLALPLSRSSVYLGRLAGFAGCAAALASVFAAPLFFLAPPAAVALWGLSLMCEAALMAAIALFFSITLAQPVPAIAATIGLYVLARSMAAIQSIAGGPLTEPGFANQAARWSVDGIALILPALDAVTKTEWLIYGLPSTHAYASALGALALYAALVAAAGLIDFHRRSF